MEIAQIADSIKWANLSSGAYCVYDNDYSNVNTYGLLYNWYAVEDNRNIGPEGWHIPTDAEWQILVDYLGGYEVAGAKMKNTGTMEGGDGLWYCPNLGATNSSGFSGLPGGFRISINYTRFVSIGLAAYFWESEDYANLVWYRMLSYADSIIGYGLGQYKNYGFSVRCIRN